VHLLDERVERSDPLASPEQLVDEVRADEARASRDQD
jgi:hypothetical protein